jgi:DNA-binding NtrC family response regulator
MKKADFTEQTCIIVPELMGSKGSFMNILLVEDDRAVSSVLTDIICRWGYGVENANTCKNALMKVSENHFDLVLLDVFLPDCKGHELIPRMRELWPAVRIITMTGYNSRELEMAIRKQGVLYYMTKPFDPECLKGLLDHIAQKTQQSVMNLSMKGKMTMNTGHLVEEHRKGEEVI